MDLWEKNSCYWLANSELPHLAKNYYLFINQSFLLDTISY